MTNGLLDPVIVAFVFTPLAVSVAGGGLLMRRAAISGRRRRQGHGSEPDAPAALLAWAVGAMPQARREWGIARLAELAALSGRAERWRFASSCMRALLFLPRVETVAPAAAIDRGPVLGLLAVALPPLALPFIYAAAVIVDAMGGGPAPLVKLLLLFTMAGLAAGVPLGLASRWRRERLPRLSTWGIASSICTFGYFLIGMRWLAGGD
jgi:hypothetical protein